MDLSDVHKIYQTELTDNEFMRLGSFIYGEYGIKMPPHKRLMLQGRLRSRLKARNMSSFSEYIDFLFSSKGQQIELVHMIDVVTTNKTDFFREPDHFDFLFTHILSDFFGNTPRGAFKIWSAGCSTGEEPYTMAIILSEFRALNPGFDFQIKATDISTRALEHAILAIYPENRVSVIPLSLKQNYLLRSKDRSKDEVRIIAALRQKVHFERHNLMEIQNFPDGGFDTIFCRNTLIYFDHTTQRRVVANLCNKLEPGGYLMIGHSETIFNEQSLPLNRIKPTIYQKRLN